MYVRAAAYTVMCQGKNSREAELAGIGYVRAGSMFEISSGYLSSSQQYLGQQYKYHLTRTDILHNTHFTSHTRSWNLEVCTAARREISQHQTAVPYHDTVPSNLEYIGVSLIATVRLPEQWLGIASFQVIGSVLNCCSAAVP